MIDTKECTFCRREPRLVGKPFGARCSELLEEAAKRKREWIEELNRTSK